MYVSSGNGIAERSHCSIKRIATRKQCNFQRQHTGTMKDGVSPVTTPANAIYMYQVQAKGIDDIQSPEDEEVCGPYAVGDLVWMKPSGSQCTTRFKCGRVTGVVS